MMLQIRNLTGGYSKDHDILQGISLDIAKGSSVGIIGLNGSGKSSLAKAILNILPYRQGEFLFNHIDITKNSTQELSEMGIALFMQGGRIFDELSVWDNLLISAKSEKEVEDVQEYFSVFRFSKNKLSKMKADTLSGGERHQLALAMCMLRKPHPQLLILDEPSAGLSPLATEETYRILQRLRGDKRLTIILIEQSIARAVAFCDSVNMLRNGKFVYSSEKKDIKEIENIMFNATS